MEPWYSWDFRPNASIWNNVRRTGNNSLPQPCCRFGLQHGRALNTVHSFSARFESPSVRRERRAMSIASSVQQMSWSVWIGAHSWLSSSHFGQLASWWLGANAPCEMNVVSGADWFSRCGGPYYLEIDEWNVGRNAKGHDSYCSLSPACSIFPIYTQVLAIEELPKRRRRTEVSVFLQSAGIVPIGRLDFK